MAESLKIKFAEKTRKEILNIHWDEKIMKDIDGDKSERLAVMVSGESCPEGRILTSITMEEGKGTGRDIAEGVVKSLEDHYLEKHTFGAMIFDTTSKNSGRIKGSA